jgi:hypothetical protein
VIEVMIEKMLAIQFVPNVNLIQRQATEVDNAPSETKSMPESKNIEAQQN